MKSTVIYLSYRFIWWFVSVIPSSAAYSLSRLTAKFIFSRNGKGVKRLRSNYQPVNPNLPNSELEKLTKDGLISYWRYWCDTFRLNKWDKNLIVNGVAVTNEHLLVDAVKSKRGCLVALPHAGNWDHAAAYFCSIGITLTAVVEKLKPEAIFNKFLEYRKSIGIEPISHKERTIPILIERLTDGKLS